jgi:hypothetical protein
VCAFNLAAVGHNARMFDKETSAMNMKLGTQTNSVMNHLMSRATLGQPEPVVGMGATLLGWTDRHAGTIVEVLPQKNGGVIVKVQYDTAKVVAGSTMSEDQTWEFERNPQGAIECFRRGADSSGAWDRVQYSVVTKRWRKFKSGKGLVIGRRDHYRDPSY